METVLVDKKHLKGGVNTVQQLFCGLRSEAEQHSTSSLTTQWRQDKRNSRYTTVLLSVYIYTQEKYQAFNFNCLLLSKNKCTNIH